MYKTLIFMSLFACYFGKNDAKIQERLDDRIIGGVDTDITKHPYQISVEFKCKHLCGGSIMNNYWVVTAAHCLYKRQTTDTMIIRAGTSTKEKGGILRVISKIIIHPEFSPITGDYDVAVIKVLEPFVYSEKVKPISLTNGEPSSGAPVIVTGWGALSEALDYPIQLQEVEISIISRSVCSKHYENINNITQRMICAGVPEGGKIACLGDSGGPLVNKGILVGVVSWGESCADMIGVYSNVAVLKKWLNLVINENEQQVLSNLKIIF